MPFIRSKLCRVCFFKFNLPVFQKLIISEGPRPGQVSAFVFLCPFLYEQTIYSGSYFLTLNQSFDLPGEQDSVQRSISTDCEEIDTVCKSFVTGQTNRHQVLLFLFGSRNKTCTANEFSRSNQIFLVLIYINSPTLFAALCRET